MGLTEIVAVRQYTDFTPAGKIVKMYEVKFTTEKTEGEFTFGMPKSEFTAAKALKEAKNQAEQIDAAIK